MKYLLTLTLLLSFCFAQTESEVEKYLSRNQADSAFLSFQKIPDKDGLDLLKRKVKDAYTEFQQSKKELSELIVLTPQMLAKKKRETALAGMFTFQSLSVISPIIFTRLDPKQEKKNLIWAGLGLSLGFQILATVNMFQYINRAADYSVEKYKASLILDDVGIGIRISF